MMDTYKSVSVLPALFVTLCASGCGGSGGGSAPALSQGLRSYQIGDQWTWNYTSTTERGTTKGIATEVVGSTNVVVDGANAEAFTKTLTDTAGVATTTVGYYTQPDSLTGELAFVGDPNGLAKPSVAALPGWWRANFDYTPSTTVTADGIERNTTFAITGSEIITVPAGAFNT